MTTNKKVETILNRLNENYPEEIKCYLNYTYDYELLFATILSAQCTDERVNIVTKTLFDKYKSLESFANAPLQELEKDIKSTGFYRNKAKNIKMAAIILLETFLGEIPSDTDSLTILPGVGRKTANVVRCHIFNIPSIVVDTHVKRISARLGLTYNTDPVKIEFDLMEILPKKSWIAYNHQIIAHGRKICKAPKPRCHECFYLDLCPYYALNARTL